MPRRLLCALAFAMLPVTAAEAEDVKHFLARADVLVQRGPFALLSPDFYRLKRLVKADANSLKADYAHETALHHQTAFCPPAAVKPKVGPDEYLAALRAVPPNRRATTDTKDVLRSLMQRKYPCHAAKKND